MIKQRMVIVFVNKKGVSLIISICIKKSYLKRFNSMLMKVLRNTLVRKELKRLLSDIRKGVVVKVIILNLDRLTRSIKDLMFLFEFFEECDVKLYSLKEKIDTESAAGRFFVSMIVLISQWERETISERTIRGVDQAALEGIYVKGRPPYGYKMDNKKLAIDEQEAAHVKRLFELYYYEGKSIGQLVHLFADAYGDERGIWNHTRVRSILGNEIYTGTFVNKRMKLENHSPAIITKALFDQVQLLLDSKNNFRSLEYIYGRKCFNVMNNQNLVLDSSIAPNKVYYYYVDPITNARISETIVDEQVAPIIDAFYISLINSRIGRKMSSHKKIEQSAQLLEELYISGAISEAYNISALTEISKKRKVTLKDIEQIKSEVIKWDDLSREEKVIASKHLIKYVEIDMERKEVKSVAFF